MLDLERLRKVELATRPMGQVVVANTLLRLDYAVPRKTEIVLEGIDNIPSDRSVIFAMNHPDRHNYWPFQYEMYRRGLPFTATWVKGKNYENPLVAWFLDWCNNIPLPSRGFVITTEFRKSLGREPTETEYRLLRDLVDRRRDLADVPPADLSPVIQGFMRDFGDANGDEFLVQFDALFEAMIRESLRLTSVALKEKRNNLLVFPQGTRSIRLIRGRTGMMQAAWHLGHAIVPVGCNGSEKCYPGMSPFSKGGRIVYRIGKPMELDGPELSPHRVPANVLPLVRQATAQYGDTYQAGTDVVMNAINELLDPAYQFAGDTSDDAVSGVNRFV
ncbi:MAG: 1-acyl-sn-glycerol-3-phosphate acyltransferase [Myxococcales bacterium]|nr:1-acyl-sn-glycerol-3-phosphate acyltransferase [Myxococcales bacterium]